MAIGDPQEKDFHFCEADTLTGKPYCQDHCDVAYIDERELKKKKLKKSPHRLIFLHTNGCILRCSHFHFIDFVSQFLKIIFL